MPPPGRQWSSRPGRTSRPGAARVTRQGILVTAAVGLGFLVGLSRPNAARPDLHGSWPLEGLLPWTLSPSVTTAVMWTSIVLAVAAVWTGLRGHVPPVTWRMPLGLGALSLLAAPFGSGDHLNYAAYGRILLQGGNPWTESPIAWAGGLDPITSAVEEPWTTEPSVYGPFVTLLQAGAAALGGDHLRLVILAWQALVVLAWLGVRAGLRTVLDRAHHGRIDVAWTLNPLVLTVGLLGAHVDTIATALAVTAVVVAARRPGSVGIVLAGVVTALAAGSKFTYAVVGVALVLTWATSATSAASVTCRPPDSAATSWLPACLGRIGSLLLGAVPTLVLLHVWAGPHVYDQLGRARSSVSLASPWRLVLRGLGGELGGATTRSLISVGAALLAIALAVLILRRVAPIDSRPGTDALVMTGALATAYSLAAPYTLPWYDLLAWAALPALAPGLLDGILVARFAIMTAAYVPGRVLGMTPSVEAVTLGFRKEVAPWLQLALWVVAVALLVTRRRTALSHAGVRDGSAPSSEPVPPRS